MTKAFVESLISHMKQADRVTKVAPWMVEGIGDKKMNVRYVGLKLDSEWESLISAQNNILLKFIYDRTSSWVEFYLANSAPFTKTMSWTFSDADKWEIIVEKSNAGSKKIRQSIWATQRKLATSMLELSPN